MYFVSFSRVEVHSADFLSPRALADSGDGAWQSSKYERRPLDVEGENSFLNGCIQKFEAESTTMQLHHAFTSPSAAKRWHLTSAKEKSVFGRSHSMPYSVAAYLRVLKLVVPRWRYFYGLVLVLRYAVGVL